MHDIALGLYKFPISIILSISAFENRELKCLNMFVVRQCKVMYRPMKFKSVYNKFPRTLFSNHCIFDFILLTVLSS